MSEPRQTIRVRDIMRTDFRMIDGSATVKEALVMMKTNKTSVLVVKKRHEFDDYGLLTSGDIARHVLARDKAPDRVNVYEVMTCPVIQVNPEMDIRHCSRLFATYNLVRAPVVHDGTVIGMVSPNALVLDGMYKNL
ncbi:MAG: CBS domain-containing protein [Methylomonas sp.]|nr:CBS domain-containing protein [Methylomonas sp.]PPD19501.1 MAG: histidine kinase [Methylomonas sp.]PPD24795.1 MAG: histidine kinase [Methylomonas sp.]PPD33494.1 MAG: histidine kinase [Methylomonas sp.]PPD53807.1 MAG: histidine kinase [Methylomonas sp.]